MEHEIFLQYKRDEDRIVIEIEVRLFSATPESRADRK
jgi:hypothetical protein